MTNLGDGCGLRQGEIFGLPLDELDFDAGWLHVAYQVKVVNGHLIFAPPKREKERDVPLSDRVAEVVKAHLELYPPVKVTLPWRTPDGPPITKPLIFSRKDGGPVRRSDFNVYAWKPALVKPASSQTPSLASGIKPPESTACTR
jgi:integrase